MFEEDIQKSCEKLVIFNDRIKDVFIPPDLRNRIRVPKNKYDLYIYAKPYLLATELKSINAKSINVKDPKIIKPHQIDSLLWADQFNGVISGFIFNFRASNNNTYFVHIQDFINYLDVIDGRVENKYENKINKSSIPVGICDEIGVKIDHQKKRTRYHYDIKNFMKDIAKKYGI